MKVPFKTVAEAMKQLGEEEAFSCLETGYKSKQYRKKQNAKNQAILEIAKKDPRFKQALIDSAAAAVKKVG